jgi:hypothetical protein
MTELSDLLDSRRLFSSGAEAPIPSKEPSPSAVSFDVEGARRAGYSDTQIQEAILAHPNSEAARSAGISNQQIIEHFGLKGPKVVSGPAYVASRALSSALETGDALRATDLAGGATMTGGDRETPIGSSAPLANKLLFGSEEPLAGSEAAKQAGAVASAFGSNPLLAGATPLASAAGAVGGQTAEELFPSNRFAPLIGGALGGSVAAVGKNLLTGGLKAARGPVAALPDLGASLGEARGLEASLGAELPSVAGGTSNTEIMKAVKKLGGSVRGLQTGAVGALVGGVGTGVLSHGDMFSEFIGAMTGELGGMLLPYVTGKVRANPAALIHPLVGAISGQEGARTDKETRNQLLGP